MRRTTELERSPRSGGSSRKGQSVGQVFIGTSGWIYKGWAATFYPPKTSGRNLFAFYAQHFPTVEINATFYRLPTEAAVRGWAEQAPPGFVYAVKGSRTVTHLKKLLPGAKSFDILLSRIPLLGDHLGPVLWQLPRGFKINIERLAAFLELLPESMRHAIEFRHPSWVHPEVFELLRQYRAAHVSVSSLDMPPDLTVTTDFTYIRFHGLEGGAAHDYTRAELRPWAEHLKDCADRGINAFVYFNNDINTRAPGNAQMLGQLVGRNPPKPRPGCA